MYCLYRHYDAQQKLLYIGVSGKPSRRIKQHKNRSDWFTDVVKITMEWFDSKDAAYKAEAKAIFSEQPKYNKNCKNGNQKVCVISLTENQHEIISRAAKMSGLTISTYLRSCGLLSLERGDYQW